MSHATIAQEKDPEEIILIMIYHILGDIEIDNEARNYIRKLVTQGMKKVISYQSEDARALEAKENYKYFAETLKENIWGVKQILEIDDVESTLSRLCPIFPIC
jgi:hypothetical protein